MMNPKKPIGLYVHIPFCIRKCNYCDFASFPCVSEEERRLYINELCREILTYKSENKISVDTIFFGGGTPSLLSEKEFSSICNAIYESFEVAKDTEFTVEVNPKTLKPENLAAYVSCGVNRISIGLQTIHENEYKILGRIHNFEDFITTYNMIRDAGITNINVDLMYGIPEQTESTLGQTLDAVLSLRPTHISAYGLILEEGTPLWRIKDELVFPDGDEEFFMYSKVCETLRKFGYSHYEISNYSYPGYECRHNMKYWNSDEYIGVGLAAYSYFKGERFGNTDKLEVYLGKGMTKYSYRESIDKDASMYEYVMLSLRLSSGFSLSEYKMRFGCDFLDGRADMISRLVESGYMRFDGEKISLTEKGFYVSNSILTELI